MLERTLVLVDTSYLLASFYNSWEEGARGQLEISLATVVHRLDHVAHGLVDQPVQRQNWYDGIPDSGPHRYQRTLRVIEGVQLRAGQLIEWGERRTQKAVDTLLVADMIQAAYKGQCSDMVLVTGDADMIPGVRVAVDAGVRMHLVGFGWDSISSALRHACDTTTVLDPRTDFHDAMQIRVLEGPIPPKVRTPTAPPVHPGEDAHETEESVGMADVVLRSDRASATSVAEETRLTAAEEERAADAEELAADEQECAARADSEPPAPDAGETAPKSAERPTDGTGPTPDASSGRASAQNSGPSPAQLAKQSDKAEKPEKAEKAEKPDRVGEPGRPSPAEASPEAAEAHPGPQPPAQSSRVAPQFAGSVQKPSGPGAEPNGSSRPNPSMMAPHRRPLRSKFVPLPDEVWTSSGEQTPFDVGQQYATWWYERAATESQRDQAHLLSGGVLPPGIDRPLLQFACQMLNEFTLTEAQRVRLRDGFHEGIRAVLLKHR
ncbi:NYN domain-containing protein [Dietzia maris]